MAVCVRLRPHDAPTRCAPHDAPAGSSWIRELERGISELERECAVQEDQDALLTAATCASTSGYGGDGGYVASPSGMCPPRVAADRRASERSEEQFLLGENSNTINALELADSLERSSGARCEFSHAPVNPPTSSAPTAPTAQPVPSPSTQFSLPVPPAQPLCVPPQLLQSSSSQPLPMAPACATAGAHPAAHTAAYHAAHPAAHPVPYPAAYPAAGQMSSAYGQMAVQMPMQLPVQMPVQLPMQAHMQLPVQMAMQAPPAYVHLQAPHGPTHPACMCGGAPQAVCAPQRKGALADAVLSTCSWNALPVPTQVSSKPPGASPTMRPARPAMAPVAAGVGGAGRVDQTSASSPGSTSDSARGERNVMGRKEWSAEEDRIILEAVDELGQKWRLVAGRLNGRSDDAVRNRWKRLNRERLIPTAGERGFPWEAGQATAHSGAALGVAAQRSLPVTAAEEKGGAAGVPRAPKAQPDRIPWSPAEDLEIVSSVQELGLKWQKIAARLPIARTPHAVRNRFYRLQQLQQLQQLQKQAQAAQEQGQAAQTPGQAVQPAAQVQWR